MRSRLLAVGVPTIVLAAIVGTLGPDSRKLLATGSDSLPRGDTGE